MGVPVVASTQAAGGVEAVPGEHFLVASTPEGYADAICRLLENPTERQRFAQAGRTRILSHHNWERFMQGFSAQLARCLQLSALDVPAAAE